MWEAGAYYSSSSLSLRPGEERITGVLGCKTEANSPSPEVTKSDIWALYITEQNEQVDTVCFSLILCPSLPTPNFHSFAGSFSKAGECGKGRRNPLQRSIPKQGEEGRGKVDGEPELPHIGQARLYGAKDKRRFPGAACRLSRQRSGCFSAFMMELHFLVDSDQWAEVPVSQVCVVWHLGGFVFTRGREKILRFRALCRRKLQSPERRRFKQKHLWCFLLATVRDPSISHGYGTDCLHVIWTKRVCRLFWKFTQSLALIRVEIQLALACEDIRICPCLLVYSSCL